MVMHSLFDVGTFLTPDYAPDSIGDTAFVFNIVVYVLAAGAVLYLIRRDRNFKVTPAVMIPLAEQQAGAKQGRHRGANKPAHYPRRISGFSDSRARVWSR